MSRVRSSYTLPPLEPGSCLLLHPEDVNGETEGAFYAAVTSVRQTSVEIRVIGETEVAQHTIPRSLANARRVQPEEATAEGPGTWLRKAVVTEYRGTLYYSQCVATLRILAEVYPVIAMVKGSRRWAKTTWPMERLHGLHDDIFTRLMEGDGGIPWSTQAWLGEWSDELGDLSDLRYDWVDPGTDDTPNTSLTRSAPSQSIWKPRHLHVGTDTEDGFFDPLDDDGNDTAGEAPLCLPQIEGPAEGGETPLYQRQPPPQQRQHTQAPSQVSEEIELIDLIRQYRPHLLSHYLSQSSRKDAQKRDKRSASVTTASKADANLVSTHKRPRTLASSWQKSPISSSSTASGFASTDASVPAPSANTRKNLASSTMNVLRTRGVQCSAQIPFFTIHSDGLQRFQLDRAAQTTLTTLSTAHDFTVQALVKLMRGQTSSDYLPNKTLCPLRLAALLHGYKHCQLVCSVASREIAPQWKSTAPPLAAITKNHQSANRHLNPVVKSVRKGQDARQYLVLVDTVTSHVVGVHVSPLGAVENKDTNPRGDVRLIHALSSPGCPSVNYASDKEYFPAIKYRHVAAIARRIEYLAKLHPGQVSHILKGDVKTAFRHLMLESSTVSRMGARIPQLQALVLDCSIRMERFAVVLRRIW
ncbi:hypothetical protein PC129_g19631 [Phytophthora cactorum]|uniref:Uncharacterized protein n=2 Tax=Phytophthora cactorum TaxID=29920 RepID=A0A8T1HA95_9STRA|nr:hypothetical protein PC129_g19631 [Phytophthora cactorum]